VQVNHSNKQVLVGIAGNTHQADHDNSLSYIVTIHTSMLRCGPDKGLMLFSWLCCAVHLQPDRVLVFQGLELHQVMPLVPNIILVSLYPKMLSADAGLKVQSL
jgi:ABC-type arginine transport system permease subunit